MHWSFSNNRTSLSLRLVLLCCNSIMLPNKTVQISTLQSPHRNLSWWTLQVISANPLINCFQIKQATLAGCPPYHQSNLNFINFSPDSHKTLDVLLHSPLITPAVGHSTNQMPSQEKSDGSTTSTWFFDTQQWRNFSKDYLPNFILSCFASKSTISKFPLRFPPIIYLVHFIQKYT